MNQAAESVLHETHVIDIFEPTQGKDAGNVATTSDYARTVESAAGDVQPMSRRERFMAGYDETLKMATLYLPASIESLSNNAVIVSWPQGDASDREYWQATEDAEKWIDPDTNERMYWRVEAREQQPVPETILAAY